MDKVEVYLARENGKKCTGIKINDPEASLADLLAAWQPLCDDTGLHKMYADGNHALCKGCKINCCNTAYVIPDLISFKKMAAYLKLDYEQFIDRYFEKEKINAGLLRMKPNPCVFLDNNICTIYQIRSLICRFYLCINLLGDTEQLIYNITWTGITATQLFAEERGLINKKPAASLTSFDMMFKKLIEEYRYCPNAALFMKAAEYRDIPLKPFIQD